MSEKKYLYRKLTGKIVEKYTTKENFAKVWGISQQSLSRKLSCKTGFSQKDMEECCCLLDIPREDIVDYFFN